jgi:dipeptidase
MVRAVLLLFLAAASTVLSCTTLAVGKLATMDGSVMATHSNDGSGDTDPRLVKIPARVHELGATRPVYLSPEKYPRYVGTERHASSYFVENCQAGPTKCVNSVPIGYIPQVTHTFGYFEATYGTMNEKQVSIAESTCSGVFAALPIGGGGQALISINELTQIAMERGSTAREAIQIMGSLTEKYGFYGESSSFEGGSESLFVSDPSEAWAFHILADPTGTSSIWAAARVPDDSVAVVSNMFSIREMDMEDTDNFMGRRDMWEIAAKHGLYTPGTPKDFTATFSDGEYSHKYYSGRRMWSVFRLLSPSANLPADYNNLKTDAPYPFAVRVDSKVTPQDLMRVMRDWYNGTRFSTGEGSGVAGGAFATPDRYGLNSDDSAVTGNWYAQYLLLFFAVSSCADCGLVFTFLLYVSFFKTCCVFVVVTQ